MSFDLINYEQEKTTMHEFELYCRFCDSYLSEYLFGKNNREMCLSCINERVQAKKDNSKKRVSQHFRIL